MSRARNASRRRYDGTQVEFFEAVDQDSVFCTRSILCYPWAAQKLLQRYPICGVRFEQFDDDIFGLRRNAIPNWVVKVILQEEMYQRHYKTGELKGLMEGHLAFNNLIQ